MPTSAQPPPARLPPPTCSRHVRHLLDAVSQPWPWTPLAPPVPHLLPATTDVIRMKPSTPWTRPPLHSPPPSLSRFGESFPERRRRHGSEFTRPVSSRRHPAVSSVSLVVVLISERKESRREPPPRAHGPLPQLRPPRHRRGNPAPPRRPRAHCQPRRVRGEHPHHPQPPDGSR